MTVKWVKSILFAISCIAWQATGQPVQTEPAEQKEFNAAVQAFEDGLLKYTRAEQEFDAFLKKWPKSVLKPPAALYLAQSKYHRADFVGAIEVLTKELPNAGRMADQYQFRIGENWFAAEDYEKAARAFADLLFLYRNSPLRFQASYNEALARRRLGHFADVIGLLVNPAGAFRQGADLFPNDPLNSSGYLLLAECRLDLNDHIGAQNALNNLKGWELDDYQKWQRQYLLCRLPLVADDAISALNATTNLIQLAQTAGSEAQAQTFQLQSGIFEHLRRLDEAVTVLTNNLRPGIPTRLRRDALLKTVDLHIERNRHDDAIAVLDGFSANNTNDPALPLAFRTVGELRLRQYHRLSGTNRLTAAATNELKRAAGALTKALEFSGNRLGQSAYYRGWCHWHLGNYPAAVGDFANAADRLPQSERHAIANFKLAECQLREHDLTNAVSTLSQMVDQYRGSGRLRERLLDHALYKLLRAATEIGDLERAEESVQHILNWYPESYFGDRSLLFFGQALNQKGTPGKARESFEQLINRFPTSKLIPQVQIALARTHEHERNWTAAAYQLQQWSGLFPNDPLLPDVEYERAWLTYQSGERGAAFQLFTNFIHRFSAHTNAPLAEKWVADYYFNQGNYVNAIERYQLLYENRGDSRLAFESRIAAGRAELAGGLVNEATNTFTLLIKNPSLPLDLQPEVWFALGDSFSQLGDHGNAINAFTQITNDLRNRLTAYALGRIGDSHLQLSNPNKDPN
ncbi:MAG: tetratricopeptide repeat protein, partial [Limisphaerales bacterium]